MRLRPTGMAARRCWIGVAACLMLVVLARGAECPARLAKAPKLVVVPASDTVGHVRIETSGGFVIVDDVVHGEGAPSLVARQLGVLRPGARVLALNSTVLVPAVASMARSWLRYAHRRAYQLVVDDSPRSATTSPRVPQPHRFVALLQPRAGVAGLLKTEVAKLMAEIDPDGFVQRTRRLLHTNKTVRIPYSNKGRMDVLHIDCYDKLYSAMYTELRIKGYGCAHREK